MTGVEAVILVGLADLAWDIAGAARDVQIQREKCKSLAKLLETLKPLLLEMGGYLNHSSHTRDALSHLEDSLKKAQNIVNRMKRMNKILLFLQGASLSDQLSSASEDIRNCLQVVHLFVSKSTQEGMLKVEDGLQDLAKELKDPIPFLKAKEALTSEVLKVLRNEHLADCNSSGTKHGIDQLLDWLANHFECDVKTARLEWQEMKNDSASLRRQLEYTSNAKQDIELELLGQIFLCIEELEVRKCFNCSRNLLDSNGRDGSCSGFMNTLEPPKVFCCFICDKLFKNPVVTSSGYSYCKLCIRNQIAKGDIICKQSGKEISMHSLIDNIALQCAITKWEDTSMKVISTNVEEFPTEETTIKVITDYGADYLTGESSLDRSCSSQRLESESCNCYTPEDLKKRVAEAKSHFLSKQNLPTLKSLDNLKVLAGMPEGKMEILYAGVFRLLLNLLQQNNESLVERVLTVLKIMTFGVNELTSEAIDLVHFDVESALDTLVRLMKQGTNKARVWAAQTLNNLLLDGDVRCLVLSQPDIVSSYLSLWSIGAEAVGQDESKEACLDGLVLLANRVKHGELKDESLAYALIHLAWSGGPSAVVEESIIGLQRFFSTAGTKIHHILQSKKVVSFFVQKFSSLPKGPAKHATLKILIYASKQGHIQEIFNSRLILSLGDLVSELVNEDSESLNLAISLLSTCVSEIDMKAEPENIEDLVQTLIRVLQNREVSPTCGINILSILVVLCKKDATLRKTLLDLEGLKVLLELATSQRKIYRVHLAHLFRTLLEFDTCPFELCQTGGISVLSEMLQEEESSECRRHAVVALEILAKHDVNKKTIQKCLSMKNLLSFLCSDSSTASKEAATALTCIILTKLDAAEVFLSCRGVELFVEMVHKGQTIHIKRKAAEALVILATVLPSAQKGHLKVQVLSIMVEFARSEGERDFRETLTYMLLQVCQSSDDICEAVVKSGGVNLIVEALENAMMREFAAASLAKLVSYKFFNSSLLDMDFLGAAVRCMTSDIHNLCLVDLGHVFLHLCNDSQTAAAFRQSGAIAPLAHILKEDSKLEAKQVAAATLAQIARYDVESISFIREEGIIKKLIATDALEAWELLNFLCLDPLCRQAILKEDAVLPVVVAVSHRNTTMQELSTSILLNLTRGGSLELKDAEGTSLVQTGILGPLLDILSQKLQTSQKTIQNSCAIVRNLSLAFPKELLDEGRGIIKGLLGLIGLPPMVNDMETVRVAVIALERFMQENKGRNILMQEGGIGLLIKILESNAGIPPDAKGYVGRIIVMLLDDQLSCKAVCESMSEVGPMGGVKDLLQNGHSKSSKQQGLLLLKKLLGYKSSKCCKLVRQVECIRVIVELQSDEHFSRLAEEVLEFLRSHDRHCKVLIHKEQLAVQRTSSRS